MIWIDKLNAFVYAVSPEGASGDYYRVYTNQTVVKIAELAPPLIPRTMAATSNMLIIGG